MTKETFKINKTFKISLMRDNFVYPDCSAICNQWDAVIEDNRIIVLSNSESIYFGNKFVGSPPTHLQLAGMDDVVYIVPLTIINNVTDITFLDLTLSPGQLVFDGAAAP